MLILPSSSGRNHRKLIAIVQFSQSHSHPRPVVLIMHQHPSETHFIVEHSLHFICSTSLFIDFYFIVSILRSFSSICQLALYVKFKLWTKYSVTIVEFLVFRWQQRCDSWWISQMKWKSETKIRSGRYSVIGNQVKCQIRPITSSSLFLLISKELIGFSEYDLDDIFLSFVFSVDFLLFKNG